MQSHFRPKLLVSAFAIVTALSAPSVAADPVIRSGIGLTSCGKLSQELKPAEGLDNTANALMYYWIQGYVSAANIHLLDDDKQYVDAGALEVKDVLSAVVGFCKENPDKSGANALDGIIRKLPKLDGSEWKSGTIEWTE